MTDVEIHVINDRKVKAEQVLIRDLIEEAQQDGLTSIERATAMFMEADTYLRKQGIVPSLVLDS